MTKTGSVRLNRRCTDCHRIWPSTKPAPRRCDQCSGEWGWRYTIDRRSVPNRIGPAQVTKDGFDTRAQAEEAAAAHLDELAGMVGRGRLTSEMALTDWLDEWLARSERRVRATTLAGYRQRVGQIQRDEIAGRSLRSLTLADFRQAYHRLVDGGMNPASVKKVHTVVRKAMADAADEGLIGGNPIGSRNAFDIRLPDREKPVMWSPDQLARFLDRARQEREYPLWRFLAATGVRRSEALGLTWDTVDLDGGRVSIRQARTKSGVDEPKTSRSRRTIELDAETVDVLRQWRARLAAERLRAGPSWEETDFVFVDALGHPLGVNAPTRKMRRMCEDAGLEPIRVHDLRHVHASMLLAAGMSVPVVSERLGHSSPSVTMSVYSHSLPNQDRAAADRIGDLLAGGA